MSRKLLPHYRNSDQALSGNGDGLIRIAWAAHRVDFQQAAATTC